MSFQHHSEESRLIKQFIDQANRVANRHWPDGRIGPEDDGELSYAIAIDRPHSVIRIVFPKPVEYVGLDLESAKKLREQLDDGIMALRGITV